MKKINAVVVVSLGVAFSGQANAILVDGNIDEWIANKNTWAAVAGVQSTIEDWTRTGNGYLNPGYGGQAYDAEAMYAKIEGGKLFIALATGHDPLTRTSGNNYGAGDFAIDFGKNGSYELGINYRQSLGSAADTFGVQGGVYQVSQWNYGLWNSAGAYDPSHPDLANPTSIRAGTQIGQAILAFSTAPAIGYGPYAKDEHYFYEMSVDLSLLFAAGWDGSAFNIHWTENCANDSIIVDPPGVVPEPASLALLGAGLCGLLGARRRIRKA